MILSAREKIQMNLDGYKGVNWKVKNVEDCDDGGGAEIVNVNSKVKDWSNLTLQGSFKEIIRHC